MASSVAFISDNGLLTVDNQFQGIRGKTTKGEITTYVEKNHLTYSGHELILGNPIVNVAKCQLAASLRFRDFTFLAIKKPMTAPARFNMMSSTSKHPLIVRT